MTHDEIFKQWNEWLGIIYTDIQELVIRRYIFWEVQKIIRANPRIQKSSSFYTWLGSVFAAAASIGVRRQADNRTDVISLYRLLSEIKKKPEVLSRERYVTLYSDPEIRKGVANCHFDRFAGVGNTHVDRRKVEKDIGDIAAITSRLKDYANERVAHYSKKDPKTVPTYNDLNKCIDFLEELIIKYWALFRAETAVTLLPTWQYDWKGIFREPWIPASIRNTKKGYAE
ncbi:MAG: hypothetical protein IT393_05545 [Nitrospirae bacterium]|nr:hypothetical protein [Nitrospirota bacterium]